MPEQISKNDIPAHIREQLPKYTTATFTANPRMPVLTPKSAITAILLICLALIALSLAGFITGQISENIKNGNNCKALRSAEQAKYESDLNYYKESLAGEKKNTDKILECVNAKQNFWNFRECILKK